MEKERDFYFGKLREIELLCQEHGQENDNLVQRLMEVLYASDEHVSVTGPGYLCSEVTLVVTVPSSMSLRILPWDLGENYNSARAFKIPRGIDSTVIRSTDPCLWDMRS